MNEVENRNYERKINKMKRRKEYIMLKKRLFQALFCSEGIMGPEKTKKEEMEEQQNIFEKKLNRVNLIVSILFVGIITTGLNIFNGWQVKREIDIQEQEIEVAKQPGFVVERSITVPIGEDVYQKYYVHNVKENVQGGEAKALAVLVIKNEEAMIKMVAVEGALYSQEEIYDEEEQRLQILVKDLDKFAERQEQLKLDICRYLEQESEDFSFSVEKGVVIYFTFSNQENEEDTLPYIVYLDESVCYKDKEKYVKCDRYIMNYDKPDVGEEYQELVKNIGDRLMDYK